MLGEQHRINVSDLIWTSVAQPRQRMIVWLGVHGRLLTKARMAHLNIPVDDANCCLCSSQVQETAHHLFAECDWFKEVKTGVLQWAGVQLPTGDIKQVLERIRRKHWKQFYKEVVVALWSAIIYQVWKARN
ncbi:uncharacterized protein LOC132041497 [Lycium ferocissimum]|uniref:uncharacterized protein LOC132041497 n=1 Tax=Lycium ferocissimum TaxID=112874 RepID=UPI002815FA2B|nr:uncharacterized protein LOC132041497 [Lycium ferocissimum]